jgi:hypothetical protein
LSLSDISPLLDDKKKTKFNTMDTKSKKSVSRPSSLSARDLRNQRRAALPTQEELDLLARQIVIIVWGYKVIG